MKESKGIENKTLVEAIKAMYNDSNAETQTAMIAEAIHARFITPVVISPEPPKAGADGNSVLPEGTTISFMTLKNENEEEYFIVFTDAEELRRWRDKEDERTMVMTYEEIASLVLDSRGTADGFAINPYGSNVIFKKELVEKIKEQLDSIQ